jgi:hypothetical protein
METKFVGVVVALCIGLYIQGCATNSDGSTTIGVKGSPGWIESAPKRDVDAYFDAMQLHELCILWQVETRDRRNEVLNQIALSLQRRGRNPLLCY